MKTGRNDPCPCGSGRKYKKCCLPGEEAQRTASEPEDAGTELHAKTIATLLRYARRPEMASVPEEALHLFRGDHPSVDPELADDEQAKFLFYLLFDHPLEGGRSIAEAFLEEGRPSGVAELGLIRRLCGARLRLYEVEEVHIDRGLSLRDLWNDQGLFVSERSATRQLARWDLLAVRVAGWEDGTHGIDGGVYLLPARIKQTLLKNLRAAERELRRRWSELDEDAVFRRFAVHVHHLWLELVVAPLPPPKLVTGDGEEMVFGKVVFDVSDSAAVTAALAARADVERDEDGSYRWFREEGELCRSLGRLTLEEGRLVLEVTSRERAARGREWLEDAAGAALRHRATRYENVEKAMARTRGRAHGREESGIPPEEAARFIAEYKERHYATWPDTPLPALRGRTPRQAAADPKLRRTLVDLLKEIENMESRARRPEDAGYDFRKLWTALGVEADRHGGG